MDLKELLSERAQENKQYNSVIIQPTQEELELIHKLIEVFPNLVSIDYAPEKFMQLLSDLFGYTFLETEDSEVQREILKRLVDEYHRKGLVSTLQKIANRAHSENFYLGDLTYYHGELIEGYSSITFPRDSLFRYDYSKWDGHHRWPDAREWRDGVVQIDISMPTDPYGKILDMIDFHLAAGLKYYISILRDIAGDTGYIDMAYKVFEDIHDITIHSDIGLLSPYVTKEYFRYDFSRWDNERWCENDRVSVDQYQETKPQAAIHRIFYPIDFGYTVAEVYDEPFMWNWNRFCGIIGGVIDTEEIYQDLGFLKFDTSAEDPLFDIYWDPDTNDLRPNAKSATEFTHDTKPYDDVQYDAHYPVSVEILEEVKHKEELKMDSVRAIDESAWDGDEVKD